METREERKARLAALRASASRKREAERAPSELYEDEVVGEDPQEEEGDEEGSLGEDAHTATGGEKRCAWGVSCRVCVVCCLFPRGGGCLFRWGSLCVFVSCVVVCPLSVSPCGHAGRCVRVCGT